MPSVRQELSHFSFEISADFIKLSQINVWHKTVIQACWMLKMHKWSEHFMVYSCIVHCLRENLEAMGVGRPSVWGPSSNWILLTFLPADNRKGYSQCRTWRNVLVSRRNRAQQISYINPLTPNDHYSGRTAPLTSKGFILYIYSTNIGTEYFKHGIYSQFFSLQNAVCFIILMYLVPVLFTFYIQTVLKLKKIIPAPKG